MKSLYIIMLVSLLYIPKGHAQKWRVSEDIYQKYNYTTQLFETVDSTKFSYHQTYGRGSSRNNDTIRYDNRRKYKVNKGGIDIIESYTQQFYPDGDIQVTTRQAVDSITKKWYIEGVDSFYMIGNILDMYVMNELLHNGSGYALYPTRRTRYTHDLNGMLTAAVSEKSYAFSNVWTNVAMHRYGYTNGNITADSFFGTGINQTWLLDYVTAYGYDQAGVLAYQYKLTRNTTGGLDTFTRILYINNPQGSADTAITQFYNAGQWTPILHTAYSYHANGDVHTEVRITPGSTQPYASADRYIYNQYGHLAEREFEQYNVEKTRHIFTYEHYWPASVASEQMQGVDIKIAPVPSSDIITILARFANATKVQVVITDVQGRVVMQWQDKLIDNNYRKQVPVGQLSPGSYFISFDTGSGKVSKQLVVK